MNRTMPVAVIGGGPVGLAAAVHLLARGLDPIVLEAGPRVGHSIREWGHVRMFSPWQYLVDREARALLEAAGWIMPDEAALPTGQELVEQYLEPLAGLDALHERILYSARVVAVSRHRLDKVKNAGREASSFVVRWIDAAGEEREVAASAVIDASGTWTQPNPMGANGLTARGETALADRIRYGIPDIGGGERSRYAGRRTLVLGAGHSAINNLLGLAALIDDDPSTRVLWGMRRDAPGNAFGGGAADGLPARGALGDSIRRKVEERTVQLLTSLYVTAVERDGEEVVVRDESGREAARVDELIVSTGARPDLGLLRELRLDLDPALECPRVLGPLIDPNEHSCGSVRPHGALELEQPEPGFFIVGMKSYGRAPTFLLATGYEQVRSVSAYLVGDLAGARRVMLELPETGVCNVTYGKQESAASCCGVDGNEKENAMSANEIRVNEVEKVAAGCCGGPADEPGACCEKDADAKAAGDAGCGCSSTVAAVAAPASPAVSCCG